MKTAVAKRAFKVQEHFNEKIKENLEVRQQIRNKLEIIFLVIDYICNWLFAVYLLCLIFSYKEE
jgi:hypothetical protein